MNRKRVRPPIKPSLSMALIGLSMLVIVGAVLIGGVRGIVAALLALPAVPIAGFTYDQIALTRKGRSLATTVEEIQALKKSDELAFTRPLTAIFRSSRGSSARGTAPEPAGETTDKPSGKAPDKAHAHSWAVAPAAAPYTTTAGTAGTSVTPVPAVVHAPSTAAADTTGLDTTGLDTTGLDTALGAAGPDTARGNGHGPHAPASGGAGPDGRREASAEPRPTFWQSLTVDERRSLRARAHDAAYRPGDVLCQEGRPADHVILITSGWAKVWVHEPDGVREIAYRGPGDLVGERAALLVRSRSAMVTAETEVGALQTRAESFLDFLNEHPRVQGVLEREVYERLTEVPPHAAMPGRTGLPPWAGPPAWDGASRWAGFYTGQVGNGGDPHGGDFRGANGGHGSSGWLGGPLGWPGRIVYPPAPAWSGGNCSVLLTDIAGFGGHGRDDDDRMLVRDAMYGILQDAFAGSGLGHADYYQEDRGDGALIIVPPDTPTRSVVDPMLARLEAGLRRHNRRASEATRLQLRVALHVGPVTWDPRGVSGTAIIQTARLLEAPVLKTRLAETVADLGFIASTFVYESVIQQGPGFVDPACYRPVEIQVKESALTGWMYLAGGSSLRAV